MKMVMAIVRPERLQCVKDALKDAGVNGMTITHVTGRGEQRGLVFTNRVGEFVVDEIEKVKIETIIEDKCVDCIIDAIQKAAVTGIPGDGRIFVMPVEMSVRIRTRESGPPADMEQVSEGGDAEWKEDQRPSDS